MARHSCVGTNDKQTDQMSRLTSPRPWAPGTFALKRTPKPKRKKGSLACVSIDAFIDTVVTASFGVDTTQVCGYSLPTLLAHADNALYTAKHAGRNRVSVHRAGGEAQNASV